MKRKVKTLKLKGKSLLSRLTGLSFPAGASWKPSVDERNVARRLLTFFEDRRVLYLPYHMEVGIYVIDSILEIRRRLSADLEKVADHSVLGESIGAMRAACRKFLNETQNPNEREYGYGFQALFWQSLGELRAIFGLHIARIAYVYDLEVKGELTTILPEEDKKESFDEPHRQPTQMRKTS